MAVAADGSEPDPDRTSDWDGSDGPRPQGDPRASNGGSRGESARAEVLEEILSVGVAGQRMGSYELVEILGTGAFGEVWRARDLDLNREVAVKLLRTGAGDREYLSRFKHEQEILAQLKHPNLATLYDAGVGDAGFPYFAMEYVRGSSITTFCDREKLGIRARLELFAQVCDAVQYAHSNNIAHRDLKPANVLVEFGADGAPRPVVIDFGIAKSMSPISARRGPETLSHHLLGTPEYMSPEQILPRGTAIDNLSDVYALGVILYELLAGLRPFDFRQLREEGKWDEIQRIVMDVEPPSPSRKLSTVALSDAGAAKRIADARREQLEALEWSLSRELQWIPLKALRKDRQERYQTAHALAEDVRRYLAGRPIVAAPDSATYRLRKFVRRNKAAVAVASLAITGIAAGVAGQVHASINAAEAAKTRISEQAAIERKRLLAAQRETLRSLLLQYLRTDLADASEGGATARMRGAYFQLADSWRRFCEGRDTVESDAESNSDLVADLRILGEAALQAARWAQSERPGQTGGSDPAERSRWMAVARDSLSRLNRVAPKAPDALAVSTALGRSEVDVLSRERKFEEVIRKGAEVLGQADATVACQARQEDRDWVLREIGKLRTTVADAHARLALGASIDQARSAHRARELELRTVEVQRRRALCDNALTNTAANRHELMIALERLSYWHSDPKAADFRSKEDLDLSRARESELDEEYRRRYSEVPKASLSELEALEFATWSVREADADWWSRQGASEESRVQACQSLQLAVSRLIDTCVAQLWKDTSNARLHLELARVQQKFLTPGIDHGSALDPSWIHRELDRISMTVVEPARAARAETRTEPILAMYVRLQRLGGDARRAYCLRDSEPGRARSLTLAALATGTEIMEVLRERPVLARDQEKMVLAEVGLAVAVARFLQLEGFDPLERALQDLRARENWSRVAADIGGDPYSGTTMLLVEAIEKHRASSAEQ